MTRKLGLATIVLTLLIAVAAPFANAQLCSMDGTAGQYGFTGNGVLLPPTGPIPIAAVGKLTLRVDGTLVGVEARSVGGGFANETLKGTWSVNSNCLGTLKAQVFENGALVRTSVLSFVVDSNQTQTRNVQKSLTLPDGSNVPAVITFEAKKIF